MGCHHCWKRNKKRRPLLLHRFSSVLLLPKVIKWGKENIVEKLENVHHGDDSFSLTHTVFTILYVKMVQFHAAAADAGWNTCHEKKATITVSLQGSLQVFICLVSNQCGPFNFSFRATNRFPLTIPWGPNVLSLWRCGWQLPAQQLNMQVLLLCYLYFAVTVTSFFKSNS